jgi:hypothetical protein
MCLNLTPIFKKLPPIWDKTTLGCKDIGGMQNFCFSCQAIVSFHGSLWDGCI